MLPDATTAVDQSIENSVQTASEAVRIHRVEEFALPPADLTTVNRIFRVGLYPEHPDAFFLGHDGISRINTVSSYPEWHVTAP